MLRIFMAVMTLYRVHGVMDDCDRTQRGDSHEISAPYISQGRESEQARGVPEARTVI